MSSPPKSNPDVEVLAATPPANGANGHSNEGESTPEVSPSPKISRKDEVAMKRAAKKKEEEDNLRFKPTISKRKSSAKSGEIDSPAKTGEAYSRLYTDARKKQEEAKVAPKPEFTFKPSVQQRPGSTTKDKARAKSPMETSSRLHNTPSRMTRVEEPKNSFKPTISKRAKSLERNPGISTADRLYAQAVIAKEKQEKMREQARQQEERALTFVPSTNESLKPKTAGERKAAPVSERMQSYIDQRNKKIEEARKEKEAREAAEFTGRPSIGKRKDAKNTTPVAGKNVFDRLTKVEKPAEAVKDEEETFKPHMFTSKRSQSASKANRHSIGNEKAEAIHERLYREAEQRRRELAAERDLARQEEEKQLTFTPQISTRLHDGSHEVPQVDANGTPVSVFRRLNSISKGEIVEKNERLKAQQELEECTFHPAINPKSAGLFQATEPVHVRLMKEAERQKALKEHMELRKAEEELLECTFTPDLTKTSLSMSFNNGHAGRNSGEFSRGASFAFSEVDETEKRSPPKVARHAAANRSPALTPATSPAVSSSPAPTAPAPAGLTPISAGKLPAGLVALNLSPAPSAGGLKQMPVLQNNIAEEVVAAEVTPAASDEF